MARKIFTEYQNEFIRDHAITMTNREIADALGLDVKQVKGRCDSQKLRAGIRSPVFEKDDIEYIKKFYNAVETREIADKLGKTVKQVSDKAYSMGIMRDISRHIYNRKFFEVIDDEYKAYWFGFMMADGYISKTTNKNTGNIKCVETGIALKSEDRHHLEKFIEAINGTQAVCDTVSRCNDKTFKKSQVAIYGKEFAMHLENKGCTERKSLTLKFPNERQLPKHLQRHFIRGYNDGDGCLYVGKTSRAVVIVGTNDFLKEIANVFERELGLNKTKMSLKGNAYTLRYGGTNNFRKISNFLYKDSKISLDRKYAIYENFINA